MEWQTQQQTAVPTAQTVAGTAFGALLSPAQRQYLVDHARVRHARPGEVLCRQQQRDERSFIIVLGEVEVSEFVNGEEVHLATLGQGELFGEIAALSGAPRVSNVTVSKPSVLLELSAALLQHLIDSQPAVREAVMRRYRQRMTATALRAVPLFAHLDAQALDELETQATLLGVPAGEVIVREGEPGQALYVMVEGMARVQQREAGQLRSLALLGKGDYFGEWSLLTGAPRGATVLALTSVLVLSIEVEPFLDFVQRYPQVRERLDQVAHNRRGQDMNAADSARQRERLIAELQAIARHEAEAGAKPAKPSP